MSTRSLVIASFVGTLLQIVMVVAGHSSPAIKGLFAFGGMGISLVAGVLYSRLARPAKKGGGGLGGMAAGAICAFIGILVAYLLGDVPGLLLVMGTLSSAVTGGIGGLLGALSLGRGAAASGVALLLVIPASNDATAQAASPVVVSAEPRADTSATLRDLAWLTGRCEFKQTMRLTSHQPRSDVFENTVAFDANLMSTQPRRTSLMRHGDDEFVGRSDIIGSDGKPAEIVTTYRRVR